MARDVTNQEKLYNYLVGQVMRKLKSEGKCASPVLVRAILEELLEEESKKAEKEKNPTNL